MSETSANRRDLLLTPLLALLSSALAGGSAAASPLDPAQTIISAPDQLAWTPNRGYP